MSPTSTKDPRLISFNTLRKSIGWLGILLPAAMITGNYYFGCDSILNSNSEYYYTVTGNLLTGILCAVALFLIAYRGFDSTDHISTSLAGVFALGIAMFPTNDSDPYHCSIIKLAPNCLRSEVHYIFAALFFIMLAWISLFLFTKSKGYKTRQKEKRNRIYRICGVVILIAITSIAVYSLFKLHTLDKYNPIFWLEWIALFEAADPPFARRLEAILEAPKQRPN